MEDDKVEFKIEVEEDDAEVKWFKDGVEIVPDGKRIVVVKEVFFFLRILKIILEKTSLKGFSASKCDVGN